MNGDSVRPTQKLEVELDSELLKKVQSLAEERGVTVDSVVEQALRDYVAKFFQSPSDEEVMHLYRKSIAQYNEVYERLAKS